jgi:hypothetical protein
MEQEPLGLNPKLRTPAVTGSARQGGDGPSDTDPGLQLRHQPNLPHHSPLNPSTIASHVQIDPDVLLPFVQSGVAFHWGLLRRRREHLQHPSGASAERGPTLSSFIASGLAALDRPAMLTVLAAAAAQTSAASDRPCHEQLPALIPANP